MSATRCDRRRLPLFHQSRSGQGALDVELTNPDGQAVTSATGILTNNGGTLNVGSHLWCGSGSVGGLGTIGAISVANGGIINVGGNIGLGTINASTPSGGKCSLYVSDGAVLSLNQISPVNSIQPNSVLDISGSGVVMSAKSQSSSLARPGPCSAISMM